MKSNERLASLSKLIEEFGGSSVPAEQTLVKSSLLLEHLQAARRYLLGASLDEYRSSLDQAKTCLFTISDSTKRIGMKKALAELG